jgi:chromosome segregation ATPase
MMDINSQLTDITSKNKLDSSRSSIEQGRLERVVETLKSQLEESRERLNDQASQPQIMKVETPTFSRERLDLKASHDTLTRQLTSQVKQIQSLSSQNAKFKEDNSFLKRNAENALRLTEERDSALKRINLLESKYTPLVERLEEENLELKSEGNRWRILLASSDDCDVSSPASIIRSLHESRMRNAMLVEENGRVGSEVGVLERQASELQSDVRCLLHITLS